MTINNWVLLKQPKTKEPNMVPVISRSQRRKIQQAEVHALRVVARAWIPSLKRRSRFMEFPELLQSFKFNPKDANYGFLGQKLEESHVNLENMKNSKLFRKTKAQKPANCAKLNLKHENVM